jgi:hypothetical protein
MPADWLTCHGTPAKYAELKARISPQAPQDSGLTGGPLVVPQLDRPPIRRARPVQRVRDDHRRDQIAAREV